MKNPKNIMITLSALGMAMASTLAMSECRTGMDAEMLAECITIEGSGANYQDWRTAYEQGMERSAEARAQQADQPRFNEVVVNQRGVE